MIRARSRLSSSKEERFRVGVKERRKALLARVDVLKEAIDQIMERNGR